MRILVAGSGRLGVSVMEPLLGSRHEVVGLMQNGRLTPGWKRPSVLLGAQIFPSRENPVRLALRSGLPVLWLDRMDGEGLSALRALEPDLIVSCGFGIIFKRALLDIPTVGCLNVHSSLLPKHRGPAPFAYVILDEEKETGVTFHAMDEHIDTGDILLQAAFALTPMDTAMTVYRKACEVARERIVEVVDRIAEEGLQGTPQIRDGASYDKKLTEEQVLVRWDRPAAELERMVRGCIPYAYPWFRYRGRVVRIARATSDPMPVEDAPGTVLETRPTVKVATGHGTLSIHVAFCNLLIPWQWPMPGMRPRRGEVLD